MAKKENWEEEPEEPIDYGLPVTHLSVVVQNPNTSSKHTGAVDYSEMMPTEPPIAKQVSDILADTDEDKTTAPPSDLPHQAAESEGNQTHTDLIPFGKSIDKISIQVQTFFHRYSDNASAKELRGIYESICESYRENEQSSNAVKTEVTKQTLALCKIMVLFKEQNYEELIAKFNQLMDQVSYQNLVDSPENRLFFYKTTRLFIISLYYSLVEGLFEGKFDDDTQFLALHKDETSDITHFEGKQNNIPPLGSLIEDLKELLSIVNSKSYANRKKNKLKIMLRIVDHLSSNAEAKEEFSAQEQIGIKWQKGEIEALLKNFNQGKQTLSECVKEAEGVLSPSYIAAIYKTLGDICLTEHTITPSPTTLESAYRYYNRGIKALEQNPSHPTNVNCRFQCVTVLAKAILETLASNKTLSTEQLSTLKLRVLEAQKHYIQISENIEQYFVLTKKDPAEMAYYQFPFGYILSTAKQYGIKLSAREIAKIIDTKRENLLFGETDSEGSPMLDVTEIDKINVQQRLLEIDMSQGEMIPLVELIAKYFPLLSPLLIKKGLEFGQQLDRSGILDREVNFKITGGKLLLEALNFEQRTDQDDVEPILESLIDGLK